MGRITIVRGDITTEQVDAIVNAASQTLTPGGGVCGAIHQAGGVKIAEECAHVGWCATGGAVATGAGELPARWVIHAVGPEWKGGGEGEDALLASAYRAAIAEAARVDAKSVAFPAISCGIFAYPLERAATVAVGALRAALAEFPSVDEARLVMFDLPAEEAFRRALAG